MFFCEEKQKVRLFVYLPVGFRVQLLVRVPKLGTTELHLWKQTLKHLLQKISLFQRPTKQLIGLQDTTSVWNHK